MVFMPTFDILLTFYFSLGHIPFVNGVGYFLCRLKFADTFSGSGVLGLKVESSMDCFINVLIITVVSVFASGAIGQSSIFKMLNCVLQ